MTNPCYALVLILALCLPAPLHGQAVQQGGARDNSKFVLFIHAGPNSPDDRQVRLVAGALSQKGYLVRAPDDKKDDVGGPGVDYFADSALAAAKDVADTVNELFVRLKMDVPDDKKLKPRLQRVKNPPGHLGVWLF